MAVTVLTDETYDGVTGKGVVLVDFWAEWCGPCKLIGPIIEELSNEMPDVTFAKMNVDENQEAPQKLGITSIPTLVVYRNGEAVDRIVGMLPKPQLRKAVEKHLVEN